MSGSVRSHRSYKTNASKGSQSVLPNRKEKKCYFCSWPIILVITVAILGTAGILIWQFAPINKGVNNILGGTTAPTSAPGTNGGSSAFGTCQTEDDCCNGLDGICDLSVTEVLFAGTHNSYSSEDKGFPVFFANHEESLEKQLAGGIRGLNIDVCGCNGELVLCHNSCVVVRNIVEVLGNIVSFLNDNPTEILLITIEINSDAPGSDLAVELSGIYDVMQGVSGFLDYLYAHPDPSTAWPTLRELKEADTRILLFHYNGQDCSSEQSFPCPDGLHYWWNYAFETSYEFTTASDITSNYATSCAADRGNASNAFYGINHFLGIPIERSATSLGTGDLLRERIEQCSNENSLRPVNVILVDFWSKTDLIEVVQEHNQLLAQRRLGKVE